MNAKHGRLRNQRAMGSTGDVDVAAPVAAGMTTSTSSTMKVERMLYISGINRRRGRCRSSGYWNDDVHVVNI